MLMKVSMSLEMWMQCEPSHVKCGCNVDPTYLHILKVDVMWSNVAVLWSNVDFHISNVNKCRYIVGQHNGDLRLFLDKLLQMQYTFWRTIRSTTKAVLLHNSEFDFIP